MMPEYIYSEVQWQSDAGGWLLIKGQGETPTSGKHELWDC